MKLRAKVFLFLIPLMLAVGTLIIFASKNAVEKILLEEVAKRGLLKTKHLSLEAIPGFQAQQEDLLLPVLQSGLEETQAVYVMALDRSGRVLAHTNVVEKDAVYTDAQTAAALRSDAPIHARRQDGDQWVVDVSLPVWSVDAAASEEEMLLLGGNALEQRERLGTIRIGLPITDVLETIHKISTRFIVVTASAGLFATASLMFFMDRILKRLYHIVRGTERISQGEYGTQIEVDAHDEIGYLARRFNAMSQQQALSHQELENQVKLRTQELESFVYTVSHDLRAPIVSLHGMASLLSKRAEGKVDEKGAHYIKRILANASFMEELVDGLLAISRIGRETGERKISDAETVLQEVLSVHEAYYAEKGVKVFVKPPIPKYSFDHVMMTQLFQNLISNGAKFMGDQANPAVEIGGSETEGAVTFYVKDNGIGIDPAHHASVFQVFNRLKDVTVQGTGVGLSVVKKIVDLSGGKIWIESEKGKGATFFICFPKKKVKRQT